MDPDDGLCLAKFTTGDCPEGLIEIPYYNFYAAYGWENEDTTIVEPETEPETETETEPEVEPVEIFETNVVLISEGFYCDSEEDYIGYINVSGGLVENLEACA